MILFQADDHIPAEFRGQFKNRRLGVKSVQQKNIEKTAAVPIRKIAEQTQSGGVFALAGPEPFQGEKGLDGAVDNLTSHGAVIILELFDFDPALEDGDAPLQTAVAVAAVAGEHFDAVERRHNTALDAIGIENFIPLQCPVDIGLHPLQALQMKAGKAVTQHIVAEGAAGADPALQRGLSHVRFQLLETGQPEYEGMEGRQKDDWRGDIGIASGIGQTGDAGAEVKNLIEITAKGGKL